MPTSNDDPPVSAYAISHGEGQVLPDEPDESDSSYEQRKNAFRTELTALINRYSMENGSDTPDFILEQYLIRCLEAFNEAIRRREQWYAPGADEKP